MCEVKCLRLTEYGAWAHRAIGQSGLNPAEKKKKNAELKVPKKTQAAIIYEEYRAGATRENLAHKYKKPYRQISSIIVGYASRHFLPTVEDGR